MAPSRDLRADPFTLLSLFSTHATRGSEEPNLNGPMHSRRVPTRVFVLGVNERRVTVYSQQCRALNLIWLLHETGVLESPGRVAVVGAGAGGLTAAAAAACKGHSVLLLNKALDVMPQQRFARHRWLHPRIFDWPEEGWWRDNAALPFLSWSADDAHMVRQTIKEDFDAQPFRSRIDYFEGVEGVTLEPARRGSRPTVSWRRHGEESPPEKVEAVVLAVGFGSDGTDEFVRPPVYWDSYWDEPSGRWTSPGRVLISGGGDGGLTEVLHAVFGEEFDHERILELAGCRKGKPQKCVGEIADKVQAFEQGWRHRYRPPATEARGTAEFVEDLQTPKLDETLARVREEGRRSAADEVILVVNDDDFAVTSCALNRFLVARLNIKVVRGALDTDRPFERSNDGLRAVVKPIGGGEPTEREVDSIVIRHGTKKESRPLAEFERWVLPDVGKTDFEGTAAGLLDASRQKVWPDDFYAPCRAADEPPRTTPEPPVLLPRSEAVHRLGREPAEAEDPTKVFVAALEAAAVAGLALTPTAVERIARVRREAATDIVATLFGARVQAEVGLTIADEFLEQRRRAGHLTESERGAGDWQRDPAARLTALGHLRAGALIGAWVSDPKLPDEHAARIVSALRADSLPWWTVRGYAAARYDDAPTQLAFARQLLSLSRSREVSGDLWETAYTAIRRAIRCLRPGRRKKAPDPELWADALATAGEFMIQVGENDRARTVAMQVERRWSLGAEDRAIVAGLFALRALEPDRPGALFRFFFRWLGTSISPPPRSSRERLVRLADVVEPKLAAEVLRQLGDDSDPPRWRALLEAETAARERSPAAAAHVSWLVDGE